MIRAIQSVVLVMWFVGGLSLAGAVELASPFSDHMVVQRGETIPVWGTTKGGAQVGVEFAGQKKSTRADGDGKWMVKLDAMDASADGRTMTIRAGGDERVVNDVLVGDVWIATGQSNMRWKLKDSTGGRDAAGASADPGLRLLNHEGTLHPGGKKYPVDFLKKMTLESYYASDGWQVSGPGPAADFSGVAYFFGKRLREETGVPIGLVHYGVGGSPIEAHVPEEAMRKSPVMRPLLKDWFKNEDYPQWCRQRAAHNVANWLADPQLRDQPAPHPFAPHYLWDAGIARFLPLPVKGVIWYQGESNATVDGGRGAPADGKMNKEKFIVLVNAWRTAWGNPDLPVYHVQLPGLNRKWPVFREAQLQASQELNHVGMAVTIDVGHPTDVHPRDKKPVGERLALLAMADAYGMDVVANGPIYKRSVFKRGKGYVDFDWADGMKPSSGGAIVGFEIAGSDKKFHTASAVVSGKYLEVSSPEVTMPVAIRYAWSSDPQCNLVNGEGLPASPFRTDDWKEIEQTGNVERGSAKPIPVAKSSGPEKTRVACIGDSITFGYTIPNRGEQSYPARLQALLGDKYEVRNFGNSGRGVVKKSMRGNSKRAFLFMKEHQAALEFEPQIIVCNLGINDIMDWDKFGKTDFVDDYRELVQQYKALNTYPRVIIWGPLSPLFPGQQFYGDGRVGMLNAAIAKVAKAEQIETVDMAKPFEGKAEMFPDHIHPNADGAAIIAELLAKVIAE